MKYNRKKEQRATHRAENRQRNDEKFTRKRLRRTKKLKEDRQALKDRCTMFARLSRDGFAITGDKMSLSGRPVKTSLEASKASYYGNHTWYQLAIEGGLWNPETKETTPWQNIHRHDLLTLLKRHDWRPHLKKSPLWLLAECAPRTAPP